jgi:hypothetical protein
MPRDNTRRPSLRPQTQETGNVGRYSVVAQRGGDQGAGQTAKALASALGVGLEAAPGLAQIYDDKQFKLGQRDFNLDQVDEERMEKRYGYRKAVTRARTEAGWIEDQNEFDQVLREMDLDSIDPDQQMEALNATINDLYRKKYDGLDDPDQAKILIPRMEEYRKTKMAELLERQRELRVEANQAALQQTARAAMEAAIQRAQALSPDASPFDVSAAAAFDYLDLHGLVRDIASGDYDNPGQATNELYYVILRDLAIEAGDPGLLRNIPERWEDGTPTIRAIPSYNEKLRQAEMQAENVRLTRANAHAQAVAAAQQQAIETANLQALAAVASGNFAEAQSRYLRVLGMPGAKANDIAAMGRALESMQTNIERRSPYEPGVAQLVSRVYTGQANADVVTEFYLSGMMGYGKQATDRYTRLLTEAQRVRTNDDRLSGADREKLSTFRSALARDFKPDRLFGQFDETMNEVLTQSLLELNRLIYDEQMPVDDAYRAVRKKYDEMGDNAMKLAESNAFAGRPEAVIEGLITGSVSWHRAQEVGVTVDTVDNLFKEGKLTTEQLRRIRSSM